MVDEKLNEARLKLAQLVERPLFRGREIMRTRLQVQALEEAQRSILTTLVTRFTQIAKVVDKNNYAEYATQVSAAYEMYNGRAVYGGEILRGIVDIRAAFIGGEGLSVYAKKKATQDFIDSLFKKNRLNGSRLIKMIETGELEGRNLILILKDDEAKVPKVRTFAWYTNKYTVTGDPLDPEEVAKIEYKVRGETKSINVKQSVYVKLGGTDLDLNKTPGRIHCVMTDFENFSRAKYDLRKNTHLFGRVLPKWKTLTSKEAEDIMEALQKRNFEIGSAFAGTADMGLLEPTGSAGASVEKDALLALKCISTTTGVPIYFMAWPELMSNRSTAETMFESINAATKKDRLIWEESFRELIEKCMEFSIDAGYKGNEIRGDFEVKLPLISIEQLKQLIEVWKPLQQDGDISLFTFRNMLPGIDPAREKQLVKEEREEAAKESPEANHTVDETIEEMRGEGGEPPLDKEGAE